MEFLILILFLFFFHVFLILLIHANRLIRCRTAPVRIPDIYQVNIRVARRRLCIQRKQALIKITRVCMEAVV